MTEYDSMLLFLDFDGVLHPTTRDRVPFQYIEAFEEILRRFPAVSVVISSSWREVFDLEHMREGYFSEDVQPRIIGVTPVLRGATRWDEIKAYLEGVGYQGRYIVIDDDEGEFPADLKCLMLCESHIGLDASKQLELVSRIADLL